MHWRLRELASMGSKFGTIVFGLFADQALQCDDIPFRLHVNNGILRSDDELWNMFGDVKFVSAARTHTSPGCAKVKAIFQDRSYLI